MFTLCYNLSFRWLEINNKGLSEGLHSSHAETLLTAPQLYRFNEALWDGKRRPKCFFLKAVPGTGLPDILVRELKEFKDIDYLIITFFASTLKVVNSQFHTLSPASREMNFSTVIKLEYWLELLKAIGTIMASWGPVERVAVWSHWRGWQHDQKPSQSRTAFSAWASPFKGTWCTSSDILLLSVDMLQRSLEFFIVWIFSFSRLFICSLYSCCVVHKSWLSGLV